MFKNTKFDKIIMIENTNFVIKIVFVNTFWNTKTMIRSYFSISKH